MRYDFSEKKRDLKSVVHTFPLSYQSSEDWGKTCSSFTHFLSFKTFNFSFFFFFSVNLHMVYIYKLCKTEIFIQPHEENQSEVRPKKFELHNRLIDQKGRLTLVHFCSNVRKCNVFIYVSLKHTIQLRSITI